MEEEIKRLVERPDILDNESKNYESNMIDAIQQQVKGRKQMSRLLELASETES